MFDILQLIRKNIAEGPATIPLPHRTPPPAGFRGLVLLDASRCIGCGMCAYVCVSESVTGRGDETQYHWRYEPGRCTFCARCVDRCPADALSMSPDSPPIYARPRELDTMHEVPFPACKLCGKPKRPSPDTLLRWAAPSMDGTTRDRYQLCEACRRLHYQTSIKSMMGEERS